MVRTLVDDFFGLLTSQKIVTFASFFKTKCHFDASLTFSFFCFYKSVAFDNKSVAFKYISKTL